MIISVPDELNDNTIQHGQYTHGYGANWVEHLQRRDGARETAFFVTHLKSGMTVLDIGCGPGTISLFLAEIVAPGEVFGIDIDREQINVARVFALEQGISNVQFRPASIYKLPFRDGSFDGVFAHTILQHLCEPLAGLEEIHRVLKPKGVIGVREEDTASTIFAPSNPTLRLSFQIFERIWKDESGDPHFARRQREMLRQAGFVNTVASASCNYYGVAEDTRRYGDVMAALIETSAAKAFQKGWIESDDLPKMVTAWKEWGDHPDALWAEIFCEAVGWKPEFPR